MPRTTAAHAQACSTGVGVSASAMLLGLAVQKAWKSPRPWYQQTHTSVLASAGWYKTVSYKTHYFRSDDTNHQYWLGYALRAHSTVD
eukprot:3594902-Rhodomonas_salina.2